MPRLALAALALAAVLGARGTAASAPARCPLEPAAVAYVRGGALRVVDLRTCRERVLVSHGVTGVRWSPTGRWIAVGNNHVVGVQDGRVLAGSGEWAPRTDVLARITDRGGLVLQRPGEAARRLLPDGWGASSLIWTPRGDLVLTRRLAPNPDPDAIWLVHPRTRVATRVLGGLKESTTPVLASVSPDGRWLAWWQANDHAISANADGMPLAATRLAVRGPTVRVVRWVLGGTDFLSWCGSRLVVSAGLGRYTTAAKRLVVASPPGWLAHDRSKDAARSWISPVCSPTGDEVAASAGRNWVEGRFGREHRSIWLLSANGRKRRLTSPPVGSTDELPQWTRDGRSILFIRSYTYPDVSATGALFLVGLDGAVVGPIARLGSTSNYYGHYAWADLVDVFQPPPS